VVVCVGPYEVSPLKRACRRRYGLPTRSGVEYACYCVGSSVGLILILLALGPMSITWMAVGGAIVLRQKVLPGRPSLDCALALALVAAGLWVALAPSSVPGLVVPMPEVRVPASRVSGYMRPERSGPTSPGPTCR